MGWIKENMQHQDPEYLIPILSTNIPGHDYMFGGFFAMAI